MTRWSYDSSFESKCWWCHTNSMICSTLIEPVYSQGILRQHSRRSGCLVDRSWASPLSDRFFSDGSSTGSSGSWNSAASPPWDVSSLTSWWFASKTCEDCVLPFFCPVLGQAVFWAIFFSWKLVLLFNRSCPVVLQGANHYKVEEDFGE